MAKYVFGYIRVSSKKQEEGVSLPEQRDAISRYAERSGLAITDWFEETKTAAKRGRPEFTRMLRLLRQRKADGVVIHKIDRSARNLRDWADLGEMIDAGVDVHFANETLDLHTRGGRLSADIQAVVAADYIRNLREETRKGFYGRLKQGRYPWPAPIGYRDMGKGKLKEPDPVQAPLVRKTFELYATGTWTLDTIGDEMYRRGLRSKRGGRMSRNGLSKMLNNPFYIGLINLRRTREAFAGAHQPLISKSLFDRTQAILTGKTNTKTVRHDFLFRRLLNCAKCGYSLTGELQKGRVYYRCHIRTCRGTAVREDAVDDAVRRLLRCLALTDEEQSYIADKVTALTARASNDRASEIQGGALRLKQLKDRLNRLTDAYIDRLLDRELFEERKSALLHEQKSAEEEIERLASAAEQPDCVAVFFELIGTAYISYEIADSGEKRELLDALTSNRVVHGKSLELTLRIPFGEVANRAQNTFDAIDRDRLRTMWDTLLPKIIELLPTDLVLMTRLLATSNRIE